MRPPGGTTTAEPTIERRPAPSPGPSSSVRSRVAWGVAIASIALGVVWGISTVALDQLSNEPHIVAVALASASGFAIVGALIASRTSNLVGWVMLAIAAAFGIFVATGAYTTYAIDILERPLPLHDEAALLATLAFFVSLMLIPAIAILFPTGRPRWPWLWHAYRVAFVVTLVGFAILPQTLTTFTQTGVPSPFAIEAWRPVVGPILGVSTPAVMIAGFLGIASLVPRSRRSTEEERQQIRWFLYVGIGVIPLLALLLIAEAVVPDDPSPGGAFVLDVTSTAFFTWVLVGTPLAIGVAILRYRLYDLDVVIRKALVGAVMAGAITIVYAVIVGVGSQLFDSAVLSFLAAAALAVGFQPALARARRLADRLLYGRRATPYEVLSDFSERVGGSYASEDVLDRMAELLAAGTGAEAATVWLHVGGRMVREASWPADAADPEDTPPPDAVEVVDRGEVLGALSVQMPASDPLDAPRERLIRDLAAQAGLVLRNVRLIEELRSSRQRLVAAQDAERRKIERNIHDGAQQQLVALSVKLRLLEQLAGRDAEKTAAMARQLQGDAAQALDDLRDLARGIYPPVLQDKGLVEALESQARRSPVDVTIDAEGVERYPQEVESTVYFCVLEALQNVAKYAEATTAVVRLTGSDGQVRFEVRDDGRGFDADTAARGSGLQGMADRLDAIGGSVEIRSRVGEGTTVRGVVRLEPSRGNPAS